jgi:predicted  nucleic acid-binding Zn-ribbon protein
VRLLTETKHLRDVKASLERQLDELRDQVIALERKCKDVERSRDVELTKLRMSYERQLSGSRGGT